MQALILKICKTCEHKKETAARFPEKGEFILKHSVMTCILCSKAAIQFPFSSVLLNRSG